MKKLMVVDVPDEETPRVVNRLPARKDRVTDVLLTTRDDLLGVREALIKGNKTGALQRTDWLLDCIEEYLMGG